MKKAFKSSLSIVLSLLLLLPLTIGASAKTAEVPLSFWVASDIHYNPQSALGPIEEQNNFPGDPLYAHVNTKGMLTYEADAIIYEFLSRFEKSSAKYLLIAGDLSEEGHWDQHLGIAKILREFKKRTGKKIFLIPGNHDIRTSDSGNRLNLSDFLNVYADIGYDETLARHKGSASYTAELDGGYRLIAIDACIYREDGSNISPDLLAWIEAQVKQAKIDGKKLLGMVHHSLLDHFGIQSISGNLLNISDARNNATKFADWGIKYVLTGHVHANDISMAVSEKGNRIFDIETDSLITYPNGYRTITFSDSAVKVETDYIKAIDTKYLMKGYNKAQLDLIRADFPAYSLGCFKAGLNSVIVTMPDLTKKIANSLKIEAGTKGYEALNMAMNTLADGLNLPLYDKKGTPAIDSVEELAAK
ncbi:MAG: metallophosphoesterase, partial [Eubacteriales bacterium]